MNGNKELGAAAAATSAMGSGLNTWRLNKPASAGRSVGCDTLRCVCSCSWAPQAQPGLGLKALNFV